MNDLSSLLKSVRPFKLESVGLHDLDLDLEMCTCRVGEQTVLAQLFVVRQ